MKAKILMLASIFMGSNSHASYSAPEKYYQGKWCAEKNGIVEYRLKDATRVDCLTAKYAIEFDFGKKWAESLGQSLHYAAMTGRKPGIVLITETKTDCKYKIRLKQLIHHYALGIKLWSVGDGDCYSD